MSTAAGFIADQTASAAEPLSAAALVARDPLLLPRLPALDGLRFIAALLVILYHAGASFPAPDGVTFFFVLSGFLFAVLLEREFRETGRVDLRGFYARRAFRILPAFVVAIAATVAGKLLLDNPVDYRHALSSLFFWGNYYNALHDHPPTGFAHFWSLAVEEQFYFVWPVMFLLLARRGRAPLVFALAVSCAAVCAWRTFVLWSGIGSDAYAYNAFECRFDSLAIGCLAGLGVSSSSFRRRVHASCRTGLEPLIVTAALVWTGGRPSATSHAMLMTCDSLLMGLLILQVIVLHRHPLWNWLDWRPMRMLGALSFSAYLLHAWGLAIADRLPLEPAGKIACGVIATLLLAALQYGLVERPALLWKERLLSPGAGSSRGRSRPCSAAPLVRANA